MTDDEDIREGWSLRDEDHGLLSRIAEALGRLTPLARCGSDLIALGEAWDGIEQILQGRAVEVNVGLSIGFRRDHDFEEALFMCFRINNEEVILDELNTTYSSDVGSDHLPARPSRADVVRVSSLG